MFIIENSEYKFSVNYTAFDNSVLKLYANETLLAEVELLKDNTKAQTTITPAKDDASLYMEICGENGKELCNIIDFDFEKI